RVLSGGPRDQVAANAGEDVLLLPFRKRAELRIRLSAARIDHAAQLEQIDAGRSLRFGGAFDALGAQPLLPGLTAEDGQNLRGLAVVEATHDHAEVLDQRHWSGGLMVRPAPRSTGRAAC